MRLKAGPHRCRVFGVKPELLVLVDIAKWTYFEFGYPFEWTSCSEGTHGRGSDHYNGLAGDFGIRRKDGSYIPKDDAATLAAELRDRAGLDYDVVLEYDKKHIHGEWDPKEPISP